MTAITETVFLSRDNTNNVTIKSDGVAVDFSSVTRFVMTFEGSTVTADTDTTAGIITGSSAGVVTCDFGALALAGLYEAALTVYSAGNPNGLQVTLPGSLYFHFV